MQHSWARTQPHGDEDDDDGRYNKMLPQDHHAQRSWKAAYSPPPKASQPKVSRKTFRAAHAATAATVSTAAVWRKYATFWTTTATVPATTDPAATAIHATAAVWPDVCPTSIPTAATVAEWIWVWKMTGRGGEYMC